MKSAAWVRRWHRIKQGWRCTVGVHRWHGHRDLGDGVNVMPISGYRNPQQFGDWRVCTWCGAHSVAAATNGEFVWGRTHHE